MLGVALTGLIAAFPYRMPGGKMSITGTEIFIFLILLMNGPAAATLAAAAEAFFGSCQDLAAMDEPARQPGHGQPRHVRLRDRLRDWHGLVVSALGPPSLTTQLAAACSRRRSPISQRAPCSWRR